MFFHAFRCPSMGLLPLFILRPSNLGLSRFPFHASRGKKVVFSWNPEWLCSEVVENPYSDLRGLLVAGVALRYTHASLSWKVRSARDRTVRTFHIRVRSNLKVGQNSTTFTRKFKNSGIIFNIFYNIGEIPTKFHKNLNKNQWEEFKNNEFLQNLPTSLKNKKCEKVWREVSDILSSERCKSM